MFQENVMKASAQISVFLSSLPLKEQKYSYEAES